MDRIVVVGCGGSGKTVVARQIGQALDLPVVHLDGIYYDADWNTLPNEEFAARQRDVVAQHRWVIDGNYASTLPIRLTVADTVVFLDLPALACLWGVARRRRRYGGGQHPEVGVYDRVNRSFLRYVVAYRRTMAPRVRALVDEHAPQARFVGLTSRRQATQFVEQIRTAAPTRA
jgi:adenylate kinase family enzyme